MLLCSFYKWLVSNALDNGVAPSGRLREHLDRCPNCRRFYEVCRRLGEGLAAQANEDVCAVGSASTDRIVAAAASPMQRRLERAHLAAAAAIVIAALAAIHYHSADSKPPRPDYSAALRAIEDIRIASRTIAGPMAEQPAPAAITYAAQKPLAAELAALTGRTRSALQFLADCAPLRVPHVSTEPAPDEEDISEIPQRGSS